MRGKMIVILEGMDKVGKTSVKEALRRAYDNKVIIVDRFTGSNFVYALFHGRETIDQAKQYLLIEEKMKDFPILPVYLIASSDKIAERIEKHNETDIGVSDYDSLKKLYDLYLKMTPFDYFKVDTSERTIQDTVVMIIEEVEKRADRIYGRK
jgi:thymidylate kinase